MRVIKYTLTLAVLFVIGTICATALQQTPSRGVLVNKRGETRIIEYKNIDGLAVVEGDIVLGSADKLKSAYQSFKDSGDSKHALMILGPQYRWPNCSIPFTIDGSIRDREAEIRSVINVWNNLLRPRLGFDVWVARSSQVNYVTFTNSTSGICLSNIGMIGGQQFIRLSSGCDVGRIEHEMGHAMGLFHEQSRYDRDRYVHINYNNIRPEDRFNFDQHISDAEVVGMYDFGSIMHYGAYDFAIDPSIPTIEAPEPIGQRNAPSVWDMLGAWKNFTRGGWNVRICDGTHAQAIKFWVGSVRDNTTRSRYWFKWIAGNSREIPFPPDLLCENKIWIKAEGEPHAQINLCIVYNEDPKQGMTFSADESKEVDKGEHTNDCRCH